MWVVVTGLALERAWVGLAETWGRIRSPAELAEIWPNPAESKLTGRFLAWFILPTTSTGPRRFKLLFLPRFRPRGSYTPNMPPLLRHHVSTRHLPGLQQSKKRLSRWPGHCPSQLVEKIPIRGLPFSTLQHASFHWLLR